MEYNNKIVYKKDGNKLGKRKRNILRLRNNLLIGGRLADIMWEKENPPLFKLNADRIC